MIQSRGMTLVEIMVAVAITVGMLLLIGNVFQSATDVSGTAMALTEVNSQSRVLTEQIREDFEGFRGDLPFAIIFEAHRNESMYPEPRLGNRDNRHRLIRYDRICFFANGDFQPAIIPSYASNPTEAGNLARIFYGQMRNGPRLGVPERENIPRQILTRRQKILTGNNTEPSLNSTLWPPSWLSLPYPDITLVYDKYPFEYATGSIWKNELQQRFLNFYFLDVPGAVQSFLRRPDYDNFFDPMTGQYLSAEFQQVHFLPDVTDFTIQIYLYDNFLEQWRWFPEDYDLRMITYNLTGGTADEPVMPFALYWNVDDFDVTPAPQAITATPMDNNPTNIAWFSNEDRLDAARPNRFDNLFWPQAIRFTFTLYDKNRQRFPEGQTFSYIIKVKR